MYSIIEEIKEQLKIKRTLLQTLDIPIQNSPYNRNKVAINRKKQAIIKEIEALEKLLKKAEE